MELPFEVILGILSRLPLKSIIQCKVVCKQWYKLLTDPYFSLIYSQNSPFKTFLLSPRSRCAAFPSSRIELYLLEIPENGDFFATPFKPRVPPSSSSELILQGSCNGLLCLASDKNDDVYVWNPIMGSDCIILPQHTVDKKAYSVFHVFYLFGYSYGVNKFKILKIWIYTDKADGKMKAKGAIFTLGVDKCWRLLPDLFELEHIMVRNLTGVVFNGVCHWTPAYANNECIRTFNFEEEKQGLLSWPWCCPKLQTVIHYDRLSVLNDQLTVTEYWHSSCSLTIWTMKEYGVVESWNRIRILESQIPFGVLIAALYPVAILENGMFVLYIAGRPAKRIFYDARVKKYTKVELLQDDAFMGDMMISYAPSFSPLSEIINGML